MLETEFLVGAEFIPKSKTRVRISFQEDTTSLEVKQWKGENVTEIFFRSVQKNNITRVIRCLEEGANLETRYTQVLSAETHQGPRGRLIFGRSFLFGSSP